MARIGRTIGELEAGMMSCTRLRSVSLETAFNSNYTVILEWLAKFPTVKARNIIFFLINPVFI